MWVWRREYEPAARLPTFDEIWRIPETRGLAEEVHATHVDSAHSRLGGGSDRPTVLEDLHRVREAAGAWRLEPDAIGEYFLAQLWGDIAVAPGARSIPWAEDRRLRRQLTGAFLLNPWALSLTLQRGERGSGWRPPGGRGRARSASRNRRRPRRRTWPGARLRSGAPGRRRSTPDPSGAGATR